MAVIGAGPAGTTAAYVLANWFLSRTSAVKFGFTSSELGNPPYNKFSIMRSTFAARPLRKLLIDAFHAVRVTR